MSQTTVERVKEKLSILDVVAPYVKLIKAGKYWKGLSPFTKEKTPSFFVSPERGSYYCFSSSQGGDIFTFIERMEGVDFKGALKILAEKAGVPLVYERGENRGKSDRLREALKKAEQFFLDGLSPDGAAHRYALSRGLSAATLQNWGIGYAPPTWRGLLERLTSEGFTLPELAASGLIKEADEKPGTWYDRFRGRLMFPIRDIAGRTVAFTGRVIPEEVKGEGVEPAKYLNSPETDLFKKSEILFGMDRAKDAIRERGFALLVEGQLDLLHAHQAGFTNTIALSGTALSSSHLSLIKRYAENLMLALDADAAGINASGKSALAALAAGLRVKVVRLPKGKDPADLILEDAKDFAKRVQKAEPIVEFYLALLGEQISDRHRFVLEAERLVVPFLRAIQSPIEREHFVEIVGRTLGVGADAVRESLKKLPAQKGIDSRQKQKDVKISEEVVTARARREEALRAAALTYGGSALADHIKTEYARITGSPLPEGIVPEQALFEAGLSFGETPDPSAASDLIEAFEEAFLREALEEARTRLRLAEHSGDESLQAELAALCADLGKRLHPITS